MVAGCGGDDGDESGAESASATTVDSAPSTSSTSTSATTAAAGPSPTSIEEWEQLWADERAAVVEKIKDNGWGKSADGQTLTGPEGFTIDLSQCPAGWSDTEGLTDTEIKIGNPTALSGTAADFGNLSRTAAAWFKYNSDNGAFTDSTGKTRSINYIVRDDSYDATKTIPLVDELLDSERVFAIQTLGTPAGLKVYDKINQRCVPHPLTTSGSPAWGDPVNHPWTVGSLISYGTEAVIWGTFIDQHIEELTEEDGKVRVAALVANSDFGLAYEGAFEAVIAESPNKDKIEFITEKLEITAPIVTDAMTTLASQDPDVFITMTGAVQCTQIINEVASNGMAETLKYGFMSSVCKSSAYVGRDKVGGDGTQSDGWYIVGGGQKDINAEASDSDGFSVWAREFLADNGINSEESSQFGNGFYQAWVWTQALMIAGELDGGLTRTNLILALRAFEGTSPVHLEGISINMNGNKDAYLLEGSDLSVYDAAQQTWVVEGNIIELSGKTTNCAWDQSINACG
ncbi:MAG: ABC transporter substrate-binding protein [Acidimicrobiia bacterium]|nr:ABC transporter substrate-binding protein [Acidimicrobiia bacterium]